MLRKHGVKILIALGVIWGSVWLSQMAPLFIPRFIFPKFSKPDAIVEMEITAYCACGKCCDYVDILGVIPIQKTKDGLRIKKVGETASGKLARFGTIAADTKKYPFGTVMKVPGYGYGIVLDRGGAIKGNRIDVFYPCHTAALIYGRRKAEVKIWNPK